MQIKRVIDLAPFGLFLLFCSFAYIFSKKGEYGKMRKGIILFCLILSLIVQCGDGAQALEIPKGGSDVLQCAIFSKELEKKYESMKSPEEIRTMAEQVRRTVRWAANGSEEGYRVIIIPAEKVLAERGDVAALDKMMQYWLSRVSKAYDISSRVGGYHDSNLRDKVQYEYATLMYYKAAQYAQKIMKSKTAPLSLKMSALETCAKYVRYIVRPEISAARVYDNKLSLKEKVLYLKRAVDYYKKELNIIRKKASLNDVSVLQNECSHVEGKIKDVERDIESLRIQENVSNFLEK